MFKLFVYFVYALSHNCMAICYFVFPVNALFVFTRVFDSEISGKVVRNECLCFYRAHCVKART